MQNPKTLIQNSGKGEELTEIDMKPQWETGMSGNEDTASQPRWSERTNKRVPLDCFPFLADDSGIKELKYSKNVQGVKNPNERQKWIRASEDKIIQ